MKKHQFGLIKTTLQILQQDIIKRIRALDKVSLIKMKISLQVLDKIDQKIFFKFNLF